MADYPGIGVMLGMLSGNSETVDAIKASLGKAIRSAMLTDADVLRLEMADGSVLLVRDDGQSCCEHRYMRTDDNLADYAGATLLDFELAEAPSPADDDYGEHDVQFLRVKTNKGIFTMSNHNEHNGYYGGFWIVATLEKPKSVGAVDPDGGEGLGGPRATESV